MTPTVTKIAAPNVTTAVVRSSSKEAVKQQYRQANATDAVVKDATIEKTKSVYTDSCFTLDT
jgi:hypothetical protein